MNLTSVFWSVVWPVLPTAVIVPAVLYTPPVEIPMVYVRNVAAVLVILWTLGATVPMVYVAIAGPDLATYEMARLARLASSGWSCYR